MPTIEELTIRTLGPCTIDSPLKRMTAISFVSDTNRQLVETCTEALDLSQALEKQPSLELAGAREKIYFDPSKTRAGIVTCGGLCPGLNDVIRAITLQLWHNYGVRHIYGFRYGYEGFIAKYCHPVMELNPKAVDGIQEIGGTILGSSRGEQSTGEVVDCLERMAINLLFVIGGDGTLRGGLAISEEVAKRGLKVAVVGIPKTIDNDISYLDESFGFRSAFTAAKQPIQCAHVEATGAPNGVGLVKLMGRHSGFIACYAALAMSDVNFVLIPEVQFELEGPNGFLAALQRRLELRRHAVVVVAEGAGQEFFQDTDATDASGNKRLQDIGVLLKERIGAHMKSIGMDSSVKYIDPSYIIRSVPANAVDSQYCMDLGHNAVHAAMAGKTGVIPGMWRRMPVLIPIDVAVSRRKQVDPQGELWRSVLESTGQMRYFRAR